MELTEDLKQKLRLLNSLPLNTLKPHEKKFITDIVALWKNVSMAQANWIEKLAQFYLKKQQDEDKKKLVLTDRLIAFRQATGWQLYVDHKAVGVIMTKADIIVVGQWLHHSLESLEYVLQQPKPVALTPAVKEESHEQNTDTEDHEGREAEGRNESEDIEALHDI